ncbi:MAG TPA: trigger factor [Geminicoccaceae bacterium]|nr:trigger factor [Geminicoccaceae bacterium]
MQVTELSADGLKREYKVVFPAKEIEDRVQTRLRKLSQTIRLPGFRPGKAPLPLLRKQYGRSIMGEILEQAVDEGSRHAISDHQLRPALRPKVEVTSFDEGKDLEFSVGVEVLPEVPEVDLEAIELVRLVTDLPEERVEQSVQRLASTRQKFEPLETPRPAVEGDQVVLDFEGTIDGAPFEGGSAKDFRLVLGTGGMIPGFEAALVGASAGEEKEIDVTFPADYPVEALRGKAARFKVSVKEIRTAPPATIDDDWAKELGFQSLDEVRNVFRQQIQSQHAGASRMKLKRALLDHLAERYAFEVPPGLVELEFETIWKQVLAEMQQTGEAFAAPGEPGKSEELVKAEYRRIAERRVRLGLILSDLGTRHEVKVEPEELQRAVIAQAQRFQGQERRVFDFYRNNPAALEQLRAPIYEDKVCDLIFAKAKVEERRVGEAELLHEPEEDFPALAGDTAPPVAEAPEEAGDQPPAAEAAR